MATQAPSSASPSPPPPPPPPPTPPKQSFLSRNKFILPLLVVFNVSVGVLRGLRRVTLHVFVVIYFATRPNKEEKTEVDKPATAVSSIVPSTETSTASVGHTSTSPPAIREAVKPIPMEQQRELLKWILEEKRKVKTKDPQEKKQNDEEKALLKQLIRAKSIPSL
ncbi:hypothetical protein QVD17_11122 [Tagetes erecta]|uniref:Uncharacterized protein n=1 Tax=Tagetes erecta TaxID=13708 RepID=A0AAD8L438_TARER|nr:hypothetical protein QVD17_11122 [Tagetes erecta]